VPADRLWAEGDPRSLLEWVGATHAAKLAESEVSTRGTGSIGFSMVCSWAELGKVCMICFMIFSIEYLSSVGISYMVVV
jgi:hypothetical protein